MTTNTPAAASIGLLPSSKASAAATLVRRSTERDALATTVAPQSGSLAKGKKSRDVGAGDQDTFAEALRRRAADAESKHDANVHESKSRSTEEGQEKSLSDAEQIGDRGSVEDDFAEGDDAVGEGRTDATRPGEHRRESRSDAATAEADAARRSAARTEHADADEDAASELKFTVEVPRDSAPARADDSESVASPSTAGGRETSGVATDRASGATADRAADAAGGEPAAAATAPTRTGAEAASTSAQAQRTTNSVSRQIAELTRKPLTVDSLNELLLTIDPSVAERLLRPSSIHRSVLAGNDGAGAARGERGTGDGGGVRGSGDAVQNAKDDLAGGGEIARSLRTLLTEAGGVMADGGSGARSVTQSGSRADLDIADERSRGVIERVDGDRAARSVDSSTASAAKATTGVDGGTIRAVGPELASISRATPVTDPKDGAAPTVDGGTRAGGIAGVGDARSQGGRFASANGDPSAGAREPSPSLESQLQRGLASAVNQRGGALLIRLQPEALGQLRIHLDMTDSGVNVRLDASSAGAVDSLRGLEADVRASLEQKGLHVDKLEVRLDATLTQPRATDTPAPAPNYAQRDDGAFSGFGTQADGQSSSGGGWNDTGGRDSGDQSWRRASTPMPGADEIGGVSARSVVGDEPLNVVTPSRVHVLA